MGNVKLILCISMTVLFSCGSIEPAILANTYTPLPLTNSPEDTTSIMANPTETEQVNSTIASPQNIPLTPAPVAPVEGTLGISAWDVVTSLEERGYSCTERKNPLLTYDSFTCETVIEEYVLKVEIYWMKNKTIHDDVDSLRSLIYGRDFELDNELMIPFFEMLSDLTASDLAKASVKQWVRDSLPKLSLENYVLSDRFSDIAHTLHFTNGVAVSFIIGDILWRLDPPPKVFATPSQSAADLFYQTRAAEVTTQIATYRSPTPLSSCLVNITSDEILYFDEPYFNINLPQGTLSSSVSYEILAWHPPVLYLGENGTPKGWVPIPQLGVELNGAGCQRKGPVDLEDLYGFPNVCSLQ